MDEIHTTEIELARKQLEECQGKLHDVTAVAKRLRTLCDNAPLMGKNFLSAI
jgi:hypothetical protein